MSNQNPETLSIKRFNHSKQTKLFSSLKEMKVSGQLTFSNPTYQKQWHLYLYLGNLVYATGGFHPIRRWQRNLTANLSQINFSSSELQAKIINLKLDLDDSTWEYAQLSTWIEQKKISLQQAKDSVIYTLQEIFFDLTLAIELNCCLNQNIILYPKLLAINPEEIIALNQKTENYLHVCQVFELAEHYADLAPTIVLSQKNYQTNCIVLEPKLKQLLYQNKPIKDLAIQLNVSIKQLINYLLPYLQQEVISLIEMPDLIELSEQVGDFNTFKRPLIACIDDSVTITKTIEQLLDRLGYGSLIINDSTQAIPSLIDNKPDLILLDIIMPKINGYKLCSQIRKYPEFIDIPIIFLTSSTGVIDRFKAKVSGANDFINKSINGQELLEKIAFYLK